MLAEHLDKDEHACYRPGMCIPTCLLDVRQNLPPENHWISSMLDVLVFELYATPAASTTWALVDVNRQCSCTLSLICDCFACLHDAAMMQGHCLRTISTTTDLVGQFVHSLSITWKQTSCEVL